MANGKKKGSKNERVLSKWWEEWSGLEFSRVPSSGGLRWQRKDDITGDIICTDPRHSRRFPFSIEGKSYKDINFEHLILGNKSVKILDFWEQAKEDGVRSNRIPLLFMRYDRMPRMVWFVVMELKLFNILLKQKKGIAEHTYFIIEHKEHRVVCINSNDLKNCDYKTLIKTTKKLKRNGKL